MASPAQQPPPPDVACVAAELARLARAAGVRVDEAELERALTGMSAAELAAAPAAYARDLADAAAMGLDLNDPALDEIVFEGTPDDAIRYLDDGAPRCASSV